eukprot:gene1707-33113_t
MIQELWRLLADCFAYYMPLFHFLSSFKLVAKPPLAIGDRQFRILRQLGEGGYSYVYLATEVPNSASDSSSRAQGNQEYAIKKIQAPSPEALRNAQREVQLQRSFSHPHVLPLLDACALSTDGQPHEATELFRQCPPSASGMPPGTSHSRPGQEGTLFEGAGMDRQPGSRHASMASGQSGPSQSLLGGATDSFRTLAINISGGWDETAECVVYMLLPAVKDGTVAEEVERLRTAGQGGLSCIAALNIFRQMCEAVQYLHEKGIAHRDVKPHNFLLSKAPQQDSSGKGDIEQDIERGGNSSSNFAPTLSGYHAMLMDFGSACDTIAFPKTRSEALALQEDAQQHCTGTYRAPELFDISSDSPLDYAACDIWSLGCSLYHSLYGASPFQHVLDQPGGSLALAVLNCAVQWPTRESERLGAMQPKTKEIIMACLRSKPEERPLAMDLVTWSKDVLLEASAKPLRQ